MQRWDFSGGPVAKTLNSQTQAAQVWSTVRELDPAYHN